MAAVHSPSPIATVQEPDSTIVALPEDDTDDIVLAEASEIVNLSDSIDV